MEPCAALQAAQGPAGISLNDDDDDDDAYDDDDGADD